MSRLSRRSPVVLLALVCALMCLSLVGTGSAIAAGSGGGNGGGGGQGANPLSGSGPLSPALSTPGTPTPTTTTQTQPQTVAQTTTSSSGGGSINQTAVLGIVIGAVIVIGGVCWYIFRDAGRRTRRHGRAADAPRSTQPSLPGSKRVKPRKLSPQERKRRKRGRAPRRK